MMPDDDEPTAEEREEAERLARALEPDRSRAIFEEAVANARPLRAAKRRIRFTLLGLLGLAAAGAASFALVVRTLEPEPEPAIPSPPRALLEAQVAAANGTPENLNALALRTSE